MNLLPHQHLRISEKKKMRDRWGSEVEWGDRHAWNRLLRKIPQYSLKCRLGNASCKPYFALSFVTDLRVSLSKICVLSVFA